MMWRDFITSLTADATFAPGATESSIAATEDALAVEFPDQLRSMLLESNGVLGEYDLGLVWSVDRIRDDNLYFRNNRDFADLYMPFEHLLFFADAGNGDQFAYPIQNGKIRRPDVFVWNHESDDRRWVAGSLKQYIEWWLDGTLTL
ncbi:MAG: SMI1/KNR4 family protein [Planctomycetaceae bacterium]|nr:SMI1/KNR4 family protein [Planctomycetaceae bacterium]